MIPDVSFTMKYALIAAALAAAVVAAPAHTVTALVTAVVVVDGKGQTLTTSLESSSVTTQANFAAPSMACTVITGRKGAIVTSCSGHFPDPVSSTQPPAAVFSSSTFNTPQAAATQAAPVQQSSNDMDVYAPLGDEHYQGSNVGPNWARGVLAHTNVHRANHSAPLLQWSPDLANAALQLANTCLWGHSS